MDLKGKAAIVTGGSVGIGANYIHDMLKEGVTVRYNFNIKEEKNINKLLKRFDFRK